jgi:hypothetical protein
MERVNLTDEIDGRTRGVLGSDVSTLLIGCAVLLPEATQDRISGWNERDADGKCVVDVSLTVGGVEVPIREYAKALFQQLDRMAESRAREIIGEKISNISAMLDDIEMEAHRLLAPAAAEGGR